MIMIEDAPRSHSWVWILLAVFLMVGAGAVFVFVSPQKVITTDSTTVTSTPPITTGSNPTATIPPTTTPTVTQIVMVLKINERVAVDEKRDSFYAFSDSICYYAGTIHVYSNGNWIIFNVIGRNRSNYDIAVYSFTVQDGCEFVLYGKTYKVNSIADAQIKLTIIS